MDSKPTSLRKPTGVFDDVDLSVAPMAIEDVEKRLSALHEVDKNIIKLLHTASEAIDHLKDGKTATDILSTEESKTRFKAAIKEYYTTLEEVTISLRREIRLLNNVSKDKVLPISLVPKAEWVGKLKEAEVWRSVDEILGTGNSTTKPVTTTTSNTTNIDKQDTDNNDNDKLQTTSTTQVEQDQDQVMKDIAIEEAVESLTERSDALTASLQGEQTQPEPPTTTAAESLELPDTTKQPDLLDQDVTMKED